MKKKTSSNVFYKMLFLLLTCKVFLIKPAVAQRRPVPVRVGVVLDMEWEMGLNCISMALSDFYAAHPHYKTRLLLANRDSQGDVVKAAAAAVDLLKNVEVQAILGPAFSSEANFMVSLGDKAQVPIITFSATSPSLSSFRSPYFVRATLSDSTQVDAIGAIVQAYGWREVVLVYEDNVFGEGIVPFLTSALERVNARVPYRSVLPSQATDDQIRAELLQLKTKHTRVFVVHMLYALGSRLFTEAKQLGMMTQDYVWIITDGMGYELNSIDPLAIESMLGVVGVRPYIPVTDELNDFKTRLEKRMQQNNPNVPTPELNIFGIWAYDATIALALAVEKARLGSNNLKFSKPNISRNSTDLESFGISDVGPKLIRALSTTSFRGLAGKFQLVDGQLQSPPYEIINVVGESDRVIGYWTKENGIMRDLKFSSRNKNTYSTNKSNFGSTIWPGDKTSPGKGWVILTDEKKLKVGVPVKNGFSEFVKITTNSDNSITVGGFCIEIFDEVMKSLPYGVPYEYIPFGTSDHKMAGNYDDLVNQVYLGKFDVVAGDVTITANRSQRVDFTLPYMESGISMVVPFTRDNRKDGLIFLKPLTWELWLTSFGSFLILGILIWILEHPTNDDFRGTFWYQFGVILWFAFSTMVFAHKEKVVKNAAKFVLIVWFLVVLILTQSYTANLASMLTVQRLHPTVTDVDTLIKNNLYVGYKNGSFVYEFLVKQIKINEARLVAFNSPEEMDELFRKGSGNGGIAAAYHEIPYIKLFLSKYCSRYTMVDPIYRADGFGFVFPVGSPLVPDVSRAILKSTEGKTIIEIERNLLSYKEKCKDLSTQHSEEDDSLQLQSFWGLFLIIGLVALVALAYHVGMFLWLNRHTKKLTHLDDDHNGVGDGDPKPESERSSIIRKLFHIDTSPTPKDFEKLNKILELVKSSNDRESEKLNEILILVKNMSDRDISRRLISEDSSGSSSSANGRTSSQGELSQTKPQEIEAADDMKKE